MLSSAQKPLLLDDRDAGRQGGGAAVSTARNTQLAGCRARCLQMSQYVVQHWIGQLQNLVRPWLYCIEALVQILTHYRLSKNTLRPGPDL